VDGEAARRVEPWHVICARNAKLWRDHIAAHPSPKTGHVCGKRIVELKATEKITGFVARILICELCEKDRRLGADS